MKRLLPLLLLLAVTAYPQTTVIGGSGGGASAVNDLTDVTITSVADGDGWYYNGTAWINTNLFTAGTTDILADRMSANVLAAVGGGLTNGRVPYIAGGIITTDANLKFNGFIFEGASAGGPSLRMNGTGSAQFPAYGFTGSANASGSGMEYDGTSALTFSVNQIKLLELGGAQTALIKDTTPTTGITTDRCEDGANQGVTACRQTEGFAAFDGVTFSELSTHANGTYAYCTDCTKATPCASGGSGAFAKRINGAWDCD